MSKIMKRKFWLLTICISLLGINYSCTDDFEDTNKNPNKIYDAQPEFVFPGVVYKSMNAYTRMNHEYASFLSQYIIHWKEQKDTDKMDFAFEDFYVKSLKDLERLNEGYVGKEGFENVGSIIQTWKAYMYYILVSSFGGIPMSDATPVEIEKTYKYDTEEDIYKAILDMLDVAISTFDVNGDKFNHDPIFRDGNGRSDIEKWRKFANSLRLNIALTIQNMDAQLAEEHIRKALTNGNENYLISSVGDIARFRYGTDINMDASYYYKNFLQGIEAGTTSGFGTYPCMSHQFFLYMRSYNDPRLPKFVQRAEGNAMPMINNDTITRPNPVDPTMTDYMIVRYGLPYLPRRDYKAEPAGWTVGTDPTSATGEQYRNPYGDLSVSTTGNECFINRDYIKPDADVVLLNWAEVCFMKAEIAIKYPGILSGSAQSYYEEGIRASMAQYGVSGNEVETYLTQPGVQWNTNGEGYWEYRHFYKADIKGQGGDANHLEQIYKQWYIADFYNGYAGWTLERRTRSLKFPPHFYNSTSVSQGSNGICDYMQERLLYPENEQVYNLEGYQQATTNLQAKSPAPNSARGGDNFYTLLQIAAPQIEGGSLANWTSGEIIYDGRFIRNWYGRTLEQVYQTVGVSTMEELTEKIQFSLEDVRYIYDPATDLFYYRDQETGGIGAVVDPQPTNVPKPRP